MPTNYPIAHPKVKMLLEVYEREDATWELISPEKDNQASTLRWMGM